MSDAPNTDDEKPLAWWNPCGWSWYWPMIKWLEVDCVCCTITHTALLFLVIGGGAGLAIGRYLLR